MDSKITDPPPDYEETIISKPEHKRIIYPRLKMKKRLQTHWLIRVGDGINFINSVYSFWGSTKSQKSIIKKFKTGDILWFFTNKTHGGEIIGMAEYVNMFDRRDEPLVKIHTITDEEQNWTSTKSWDIQINYKNLYYCKKQNLKICIQCGATIMKYDTFKDRITHDLPQHYEMYKFYAECIDKPSIS